MTTDTVRDIARDLLVRKAVDGVLGLAEDETGVSPRVFDIPETMDALVLEPKWVLSKIAVSVMSRAPQDYRLAVVCRGCDERALVELGKRNRIDFTRLHLIGVACSDAQAQQCLCQQPWPSRVDAGEKVPGVDLSQNDRVRQYLGADRPARLEQWREAFSRCIKCYGCRNACPVCNCDTCKLEDRAWAGQGEIAPDMLTFHLMRSMHVADACVACGACQDACPVGIPLMLLQLPLRNALRHSYGYEAGAEPERLSPLLSNYIDEPSQGISIPDWTDSLEEKPWDLIS
ncbi:4Fe-4S dicluster domain-containing protein [uncultured Desulfosarcina sp.]|uniref:4Fe-4S dicluster domain-containing protein n=1 Tax=uncultured Desulfosarcina sp. TaxID=218289 RepID=UPI0029C7B38A|nr:4Fe-4S dicluster domain-containing protein [uncultured Desulfosarcina sp.]